MASESRAADAAEEDGSEELCGLYQQFGAFLQPGTPADAFLTQLMYFVNVKHDDVVHKLKTTASLLAINQRYESTYQPHDISLASGTCTICMTMCRFTTLRRYSEAELEERIIADNVLANMSNVQLLLHAHRYNIQIVVVQVALGF